MAAAQVASEQAWTRLATVGPGSRFTDPTVVDVDFPAVALTEAWWDAAQQTLFVTPEPQNERAAGTPTTFRVENLPDPSGFTVELEGGGAVEAVRRRGRARGAHDFAPAPAPDRAAPS